MAQWTSIPLRPEVRDEIRERKPSDMTYSDFLYGMISHDAASESE